jgi:hypothetical protein
MNEKGKVSGGITINQNTYYYVEAPATGQQVGSKALRTCVFPAKRKTGNSALICASMKALASFQQQIFRRWTEKSL